jgi:two-component system, chemotaxis family, sensor kinase CheA
MDDLLSEFLTETNESLAVLDLELVKLEQNPNDPALLGSIFRIVHTIKGTCGFLGLPRLEALAHASENVLGKIREGELPVTAQAVSVVLESLDAIKLLLAALEEHGSEPDGDDRTLIARLELLAGGVEEAPVPISRPVRETVPETPRAEVTPPSAAPAEAIEAKESAIAAQRIRVNVDLLENLMTMVGELVLTRNQLMQILRSQKESEFTVPLQRLSHVTTELQEGVMKTRMQPIGNAWAKLPRIVRDLSHELDKKIDLRMFGAETELDRQVLELINDPLTHMVRNSADHGIEFPSDRVSAGKHEAGIITLNAYHEGGHIIIEISDDGRGLDIEKIKQKAVAMGLASESDLTTMTEQQIQQFIFKAGFSTATSVTSVSGRGVGMDVVRTNIEKIGGTVEMKSVQGRGSTFIIKIPLTLAIISALVVQCANERFAIPQISVIELVRATAGGENRIEWLNNAPVFRLRNQLLPLVSLRELFRLGERSDQQREAYIVVTQVGTYTFGMIVDRVFDTEEIVVKPVAPILRDITLFSGNTILGDGSVIMILDPNGIAAATGEITVADSGMRNEQVAQQTKGIEGDVTSLLLFRAGTGAPKAVPLSLIARLEEVDLAQVEYANDRPVVQYRGKLMPLVAIDENHQLRTEGRQPLLVFAEKEHAMGLIVDEIIDIVEDHLAIELAVERPGFIGSAVVAGKSTDLIDASFYLRQVYADWFTSPEDDAQGKGKNKRILLVDDSPFFRNLLKPLLSVAGYEVTTVDSGDRALGLCEAGADFDVIISDIEMPGMNGFEFASTVKNASRWKNIPMVALSSHATPTDLDRGRAAGFNDYVAKLDRGALLQTLSEALNNVRGAA